MARKHPDGPHSGPWAEETARAHLQHRGLSLLARNYRCRFGEIDLVMREGDTLVFVEVRYRASRRYGHPGETVDARKRERLRRAAAHFLVCHPRLARAACRFDVVTVEPARAGVQVNWFPHAFEG